MSDYRGLTVYDPNIGLVFFNLLTSPTVAGFSRRSNLRRIINHNTEDNRTPDKGEDDRRIYIQETQRWLSKANPPIIIPPSKL